MSNKITLSPRGALPIIGLLKQNVCGSPSISRNNTVARASGFDCIQFNLSSRKCCVYGRGAGHKSKRSTKLFLTKLSRFVMIVFCILSGLGILFVVWERKCISLTKIIAP